MSPASADKILANVPSRRRSPRPTLPTPWRKVFLRAGTQRRTSKPWSRQDSQPTPSKSRSLRISCRRNATGPSLWSVAIQITSEGTSQRGGRGAQRNKDECKNRRTEISGRFQRHPVRMQGHSGMKTGVHGSTSPQRPRSQRSSANVD
jgi:hypothetical protein